jgi:CheY-like chemotaxis protein
MNLKENATASILLVEDDLVDVKAFKYALEKQRIANPVYVASNGLEALALLRGTDGQQKIPRPYLIILDLNMPRMNGIEFLTELRKDPELRDSVVFVLTTSDDERDQSAAYDKNIAGYIVKSVAGRDFLQTLRMVQHFLTIVEFPRSGVQELPNRVR